MQVLWLLLAAVLAAAVPFWPAWKHWTPRERRGRVAGAVATVPVLLLFSSLLVEAVVDAAREPILVAGYAWLLVAVGALAVGASWLASRFPWTGHRPWLLLGVPLFLWLLEATQGTEVRSGEDGRMVLEFAAALLGAAALPWALAGAVGRPASRNPAWKAQVGVLGFAALWVLAGSVMGSLALLWYAPEPATDVVVFTVEPAWGTGPDQPYEVEVGLPWDWDGPWGNLLEDVAPFATVDGDGVLRDGPAGSLVLAGTGALTVTLAVTFYGPVGMQESAMTGDITAASDHAVRLSVVHDNRAPHCQFHASWSGHVPGDGVATVLDAEEGYGLCQ